MFEDKVMLTVKDLQEILQIKASKAYEIINQPDCPFPVIKLGEKCIRIPREAFMKAMKIE